MFPWAWINSSITQSCASYVNNASLLKRVRVPLFVIPLSIVLQELFHFLFAMPVIIGLLAFSQHHMNLKSLPIYLLLIFLQFLIIFPFSQIGAIFNAYVRDVNYLVNILFGLVFYATPIVYSTEMIPSKFLAFKYINPFYSVIESWHNLMLEDKVDYSIVFIEILWVAILLFCSIYIYNKLSNEIRELV
jgi:lipopolysaccharide transport system permease protein